jgi:hypothetical protein
MTNGDEGSKGGYTGLAPAELEAVAIESIAQRPQCHFFARRWGFKPHAAAAWRNDGRGAD